MSLGGHLNTDNTQCRSASVSLPGGVGLDREALEERGHRRASGLETLLSAGADAAVSGIRQVNACGRVQ
jgi:hypothetical protein